MCQETRGPHCQTHKLISDVIFPGALQSASLRTGMDGKRVATSIMLTPSTFVCRRREPWERSFPFFAKTNSSAASGHMGVPGGPSGDRSGASHSGASPNSPCERPRVSVLYHTALTLFPATTVVTR